MSSPDRLPPFQHEDLNRRGERFPVYSPRDFCLDAGGTLGAIGGSVGLPLAVRVLDPESFNIWSAIVLAPIGMTLGAGLGFALTYLGHKGYRRFIRR